MKRTQKFALCFLWTLPHVAFALADFAVYLFVVINHIHKCDYMLSAMSLLSESSTLGGGPEDHEHTTEKSLNLHKAISCSCFAGKRLL